MKVLISGAFGYLGARLAELLPGDVALGARSRPSWAAAVRGEFRQLDVLNPAHMAGAVEGVDAVVHLASLDETEAARNPDLAVQVSAEGTRRLLAAARAAKVRRFIYLSTFHVYGPSAPAHIDETTAPRPAHPYGISRLAGEGFCYENNRLQAQTEAVVFRLSNGYGAPAHPSVDRWSLAHNDFCRQAFETGKIVLKTSGVQHRDMVWVGDVAQAIERVLGAESLDYDLFQVGGDQSLSMLDLAQRVRRVAEDSLGRAVTIERPPSHDHGIQAVAYSIDRIRSLGFKPRDAIDEETIRLLALLTSAGTAP